MRLAPALLLCVAATSHAKSIDFTSQSGLEATCPPLLATAPKSLSRDDERVAYAICSGLDIAKDVGRWMRTEAKQHFDKSQDLKPLRARLERYLLRITQARELLEKVNTRSTLFVVEPGKWAVDLDGDGEISLQERYFFWTPRPGLTTSFFDRAQTPQQYEAQYQAPVIKLDHSDVLWALAYCNFAEAALNLVLSYDFVPGERARISLIDRERVRGPAYRRLLEGLRTSTRLRQALLAETDDDREWIANPKQKNTSFPLQMDEQTFTTWGSVLTELTRLFEGKTILGGRVEAGPRRGLQDLSFGLCQQGQGIDVQSLFTNPLPQALDTKALATRCIAPTPQKPSTPLGEIISASLRRNAGAPGTPGSNSGEAQLLRHLYWVN